MNNYLLQLEHLNEQQLELIKKKGRITMLKKNDYFSEAGKITRKLAFISRGILSSHYYDDKGQEVIRYLRNDNSFIFDYNSLTLQIPANDYIQARTNCSLFVFTDEALKELSLSILSWEAMLNKISKKLLSDLADDYHNKHVHFMDKFPHLAKRIPSEMLSSYLGIEKSSLRSARRKV